MSERSHKTEQYFFRAHMEKFLKKMAIPQLHQVEGYAKSRDLPNLAEDFMEHYEARNWEIGGEPVRNWMLAYQKFVQWSEPEPESQEQPEQPVKRGDPVVRFESYRRRIKQERGYVALQEWDEKNGYVGTYTQIMQRVRTEPGWQA